MPIRINFLAEQQEAEEMRRRDPFKRAALLGVVIVAAGLAWMGVMQVKVSAARAELTKQSDTLAQRETKSKVVSSNITATVQAEGKLKLLHDLAVERSLWGPALNAMQRVMTDLTPAGANCPIAVTKFKIGQKYDYAEGKKAAPGAKTGGKPPTSTEKIVITIEGRDYGPEQDQTYKRLIEKLASEPYFKERLRKESPVRLQSLSERQTDPLDTTKSFVTFVLECSFPERVR